MDRPGPMTAKGCVILDANGNPVGSTSRPEMSEAFAAAYNAVMGYTLKCDVCGAPTVETRREVGCVMCGNAMSLPARDQEHDGHDGHL